ncbi:MULTISPECIES: 3-dehydroquinate synthase [unclassified Sporosarcina]|uniref:3-dehydroquinate synthase n=1 Tax=unclassified Sporosarcina TaxID=2647733 RepID=UPI00203E75AC|nr:MULTISPECIES: 3-dehydroquinate synthase [unclassified Sporosarcina]GKV65683.1 3-dehydroquinate synthase [Sporosarcina sp. NCCP-2331]GLB55737.1 3-dehydroquinate synthase [Sporosarcina sp. NCCP-2378]
MEKLTVSVKEHTYNVHVGSNTYELFATEYADLISSADKIGIIADAHVAELHLPLLQEALAKTGRTVSVKIVPGGERCKAPDVYVDCQSFLLNEGFTRNSVLLAFGGGACGDLTGFVAATFMRGIRFIQCPTTVLAHDSAVGGKTAINMPEGKNMVGSFHQPAAVLFDTNVFETLPASEMRSGMAELIKHAFISDADWSDELLNEQQFSAPSIEWLQKELLRGIKVKAQIVGEDEFEHSTRKFLNFGHTFGHAIEAASGYGSLSHGECVMIGMGYAFILSEKHGDILPEYTNRYLQFAKDNGYTFERVFSYPFEELLSYMQKDKKASFGKMNFVLLKEAGQPFVQEISTAQCQEVYEEFKQRLESGGIV